MTIKVPKKDPNKIKTVKIKYPICRNMIMQCAVYDTYVTKKNGETMHFDVIVESVTPHEEAIKFGKEYLKTVGEEGQKMTQEECQFCHVQQAHLEVEQSILQKGYFIQEMEGCP